MVFVDAASAGRPRSGPDAYSAQVPTATGATAAGAGSVSQGLPLSAQAARALLRAGRSARPLRSIATSPRLGAPSAPLGAPSARVKKRATVPVPQESSAGAAIAAAPGAVGSGGDYVLALTAAMAATALVVAVAVVARKRRPHR